MVLDGVVIPHSEGEGTRWGILCPLWTHYVYQEWLKLDSPARAVCV